MDSCVLTGFRQHPGRAPAYPGSSAARYRPQDPRVPDPSSYTVREATFELLRAFGMTTIFGNPGSTELPMFRGFPEGFRYVLGLQESLVLGMADGYAQATRRAALVNLHSAAGVGHALGNLFTAYRNQTPLVVTAGQQARAILPYEPFLYAERATEFPRPYVKWACEPARAEDVPAAIARAWYTAMQPPCGPTFVSIPIDDWDRPAVPLAPREVSQRVFGDAEALARTATALARAARPVIVAGAGVARDAAWDEIVALAERHEARVWAAPFASRNAFPEQHRLFAGFLPAHRAGIVQHLSGHDLVLVLGAPAFTYHTEGDGPHVPSGAQLIQIVDDPATAAWSPAGSAIVASLCPALQALLAGPAPGPRPAPPPRAPAPHLPPTRLTDAYLLQQMAALRARGSIIVEEAPSTRAALHDYLPILERDTFYTCASGGLGYALPAAVGVALARPGEKVIALLGDGSSMYSIQALWSAAQLRLPISFVIVRNGCYEGLNEFGRLFEMPHIPGAELPGLDYCALARGQGLEATRVARCAELDAALRASFASPAPNLLEVQVEL
ncbi:MAG: benzoylformate decarboxylase [Gammaproteobacteria bacterium]|nr:benzoylformate decarboxylase [Gammaproteobacteria bacterium]